MIQPLEQFIIKNIIPIKIGGLNLSLTNSGLFMVIGVALVLGFLRFALKNISLIPSKLQSAAELPFVFIVKMIDETNGREGYPYLPFISSIFFFIFMGNMLGMLPYSFTFTSQLIVNFGLAFFILTVITIIGFMKHGAKFLRVICPSGIPWWVAPILVPVELVSYLSRPISLAIRLFANMVAGHSMLKIFAYFTSKMGILGFIPLAVSIALTAFEFLIAFLQAYVFAMLSCIYLHDTLEIH